MIMYLKSLECCGVFAVKAKSVERHQSDEAVSRESWRVGMEPDGLTTLTLSQQIIRITPGNWFKRSNCLSGMALWLYLVTDCYMR